MPKIGISSCLLGKKVRHDGGHKNNRFVNDILTNYMKFYDFCPEMGCGLGVPRKPIHLLKSDGEIQLVDSKDPLKNYTSLMQEYAHPLSIEIGAKLNGFIFKSKSPSCGMERVPVYNGKPNSSPNYTGVGLFADIFIKNNPDLPTEEEGRLNDSHIRENFLERVYAHFRFHKIKKRSVNSLLKFHASYKFSIMARGSQYPSELGRLAASANNANIEQVYKDYFHRFMQIMKIQATRKKHINTMQHIMGYYKKELDSVSKHEILEIFDSYKTFEVPLSTPMAILNLFQKKYQNEYLKSQYYLNPYPKSLALRASI